MKTIIKILKTVLIYLLIYIATKIIFCAIYYYNEPTLNMAYIQLLLISISDGINSYLFNQNWLLMLFGLQKLLELIYASVLTGYIFAYILNKEPRIILPNKLVIRHRTSENVNGLLTLGILVGNKSRMNLYDVCCTVTCHYLKKKNNPDMTNSEFQIKQEIHRLSNYYRFSFDLKEFPRKLLKDFIKKEPICLEIDAITVSISGKSNLLGSEFIVDRRYNLSEIVIDEHTPDLRYDLKNPFTGKKIYQFIKWKNLNSFEEVSESKRNKTINEINSIIENKTLKR